MENRLRVFAWMGKVCGKPVDNVGKLVDSLCKRWKNRPPESGKTGVPDRVKAGGFFCVKKAETSDNVDNFVEKRVEKKGITVDEMWKTGEKGDSQKKNRG